MLVLFKMELLTGFPLLQLNAAGVLRTTRGGRGAAWHSPASAAPPGLVVLGGCGGAALPALPAPSLPPLR